MENGVNLIWRVFKIHTVSDVVTNSVLALDAMCILGS